MKTNLLENLNLGGLSRLNLKEGKAIKIEGKIEGENTVDLGILKLLEGTWEGEGFNLIELPNRSLDPTVSDNPKFKVMVNKTWERMTFSPIGGKIVNKGNEQVDTSYMGLHYLQQVNDVNLPDGENGIHLETGLFLNLPGGTKPNVQPTVARLGSIPHGDSLLAQGSFISFVGEPIISSADPTPFFIKGTKRVNDNSENYLKILNEAELPIGVDREMVMDPNILLKRDLEKLVAENKKIVKTDTIFLDANPMNGVANDNAISPTGGITNIPFIEVNANATSLSAIFWIETVQDSCGNKSLLLQYTQTVILEFPVKNPDGNVINMMWPHISAATLKKID